MLAGDMTQQPVTFQQVTVSEATGILGVSTQTVRRMVNRPGSKVSASTVPQGSAFLVELRGRIGAGDTDATAAQRPAGNVSRSKTTARPDPPS